MKTIFVGFSAPSSFMIGAWLISKWMNRPYSHAYVRFTNKDEGLPCTVFESSHGMVHYEEFGNFKQSNMVVKEYAITIDDYVYHALQVNCIHLCAQPYAYLELLKIFWADSVFAVTKKEIYTSDVKGYICSELVGTLLTQNLGIKFPKPTYLLKPSDVDAALEAAGYKGIVNEFA